MKVFISYPHKESSFVSDLAGVLKKKGYDVFYDKYIPIGANYSVVSAEELAKADAVIIVFSGEKSYQTNIVWRVVKSINTFLIGRYS